jgi:hypothetical protein
MIGVRRLLIFVGIAIVCMGITVNSAEGFWYVKRGLKEQGFLSELEPMTESIVFSSTEKILLGGVASPEVECNKLKSEEGFIELNSQGQMQLKLEECKYVGPYNCTLSSGATITTEAVRFLLEGIETVRILEQPGGGTKFLSYTIGGAGCEPSGGPGNNELIIEKNGGGVGEIKGSLGTEAETLSFTHTFKFPGGAESILRREGKIKEAATFSATIKGVTKEPEGDEYASRPGCPKML